MTDQEIINQKVEDVLDLVNEEYLSDDAENPITESEVEDALNTFFEHGVGPNEVVGPTISKLAKARDVSKSELTSSGGGSNSSDGGVSMFGDVTDGDWGNFRAVVVDVWDVNEDNDAVSQKGLFSDGEETVQYLAWSSGTEDIPQLEEGETYQIESGVVNNDRNGNKQIQMNKSTEVSVSDEKIEADSGEIEFSGVLVGTRGQSGLIMRDEDGQPVTDNDQRAEYDLRLQLVMDDGDESFVAHFDQELTTELTGVTLDEAKEIGMEAMDLTEVVRQMLPDLIGRYMTVSGVNREDYIFVEDYEWAEEVPDVEQLLIRARAL